MKRLFYLCFLPLFFCLNCYSQYTGSRFVYPDKDSVFVVEFSSANLDNKYQLFSHALYLNQVFVNDSLEINVYHIRSSATTHNWDQFITISLRALSQKYILENSSFFEEVNDGPFSHRNVYKKQSVLVDTLNDINYFKHANQKTPLEILAETASEQPQLIEIPAY